MKQSSDGEPKPHNARRPGNAKFARAEIGPVLNNEPGVLLRPSFVRLFPPRAHMETTPGDALVISELLLGALFV